MYVKVYVIVQNTRNFTQYRTIFLLQNGRKLIKKKHRARTLVPIVFVAKHNLPKPKVNISVKIYFLYHVCNESREERCVLCKVKIG